MSDRRTCATSCFRTTRLSSWMKSGSCNGSSVKGFVRAARASFLGWDLVKHVSENLPRSVFLLFPYNKVLAVEMDLFVVASHNAVEICRFDRDITHHMEAVRLECQRERRKVRVGDELPVVFA